MDALAAQAGVGKATIYRWWPTKEALALDALYDEWTVGRPDVPDTGSQRGDLLALLQPWADLVTFRPYGRVVSALLTKAHTDPEVAQLYRQRLVHPRRDRARPAFTRAAERGELAPHVQVDVVLDLLYGALYHRLLHRHAPLDEQFVVDVIDTALRGVLSSAVKPLT
jgi:AcrR family transcriptional regulator